MSSLFRRPFLLSFICIVTGILITKCQESFLLPAAFVVIPTLIFLCYRMENTMLIIPVMLFVGMVLGRMEFKQDAASPPFINGTEYEVDLVLANHYWKSRNGIGGIAYLARDDSRRIQVSIGDTLISFTKGTRCHCRGMPELLQGVSSFNDFLFAQSVSYKIECKHFDVSPPRGFWNFADKCRKRIHHSATRILDDSEQAGLLTAMLTGDKTLISKSTKQEFSAAGIAHILAVSGLHVSIIYVSVLSLLRLIVRGKHARWIRSILLILSLVAFAILVGAGPAVSRATFMFCCFVIARMIGHRTDRINVLSASAVVLVVMNPRIILDAGFQLSYSAVLGIILLHPLFSRFLKRYWPRVPTKLLDLVTVSLAAQVATSPFVIYHFGSFPTYFLLSNLVALPIVALIIRLGIISILACMLLPIEFIIQAPLSFMLGAIRFVGSWISDLPGATIELENPWQGLQALCLIAFLAASLLLLPKALSELFAGQGNLRRLSPWGQLEGRLGFAVEAITVFRLG